MASLWNILLVLLAVIVVTSIGRRDLLRGFCFAVVLMVASPNAIRIDFGGGLPDITIQRAIMIALTVLWIRSPQRSNRTGNRLLANLLIFLLVTRGFSTFLSIAPLRSIKEFLSFAIENLLFFRIASSLVVDRMSQIATCKALTTGLSITAAFGIIERWGHVSVPSLLLPHFQYIREGVQSTYPDQHLFGYAMAMGVPLITVLLGEAAAVRQKLILWACLFSMILGCYFSTARGPWMGLAAGFGIGFLIGGSRTRKRYTLIFAASAAVILARPGIRDTISNLAKSTFQDDDIKAYSYTYRWRLWPVAWSEISKSPERLLFGYGGLSTETMDLSRYFVAGQGGDTFLLGYTSWDSQYAGDLIEYGLGGFVTEILLFGAIVVCLFKNWRAADPSVKSLCAASIAAAVIFLFAQTNLWIFSIQLKLVFWTVVALGAVSGTSALSAPDEIAVD
jgi:hypothetical protein